MASGGSPRSYPSSDKSFFLHRNDLNTLRQQHEESLERVRRAKELEVEAVASQHSTSRSLHDVIERISENARGLNELQSQVHIKHNLSLDERENAARAREEQVKGTYTLRH